VQLGLPGGGELLVGELRPRPTLVPGGPSAGILINVEDAAATLARAIDNYASTHGDLDETGAGERQVLIDDIFGCRWVVTQPGQSSTRRAPIVPVLWVANARAAADWYTRAFGFVGQVQDHHAQLVLPGGGELFVGERRPPTRGPSDGGSPEILLKVEDTTATVALAVENGATIVFDVRDIEAGERQATIEDVFGHRWLLTQTLVDTAPEQWGGKTVTPRR
jgi:uncharacterized glyoxalase superfamily protein PhnB